MVFVRKSIFTGDIDLSYLEWGDGGEPVLLLHGLADNALVWVDVGEYLANQGYHVIAPDMRGHGDSSKPETDYTFSSAIADLEKLIDHVGWLSSRSSIFVIGHSWSGKLAAIWAKQNPQLLRCLVLVDPIFIWKIPSIFKLTFPLLYRVLPFLQGMGPFPSYAAAEAKAKTMYQYTGWSEVQAQAFRHSIEEKSDGTWVSKFAIAARDGVFEEVLRVPGFTEKIDTPTLFVQPIKGVNRQEWQLKPYKKYLTNLQIRQVPGNHWIFLSNPDEFNQVVGEFFQNC